MTTTSTNLQEARRFVEALYSRYFADHDGYVELRMISANVLEKWLRKGQLEEQDWDEIAQWNETHHIYLGVNPRPLSKEKKKNDIQDIVCLWADVDGKDFDDGGKEAALRSVEAFPLKPTIIVDSGHGYHCYWVLEKPMAGAKGEKLFVFKQVLAGVVKALGGDQSKIDHVACLRLPGTMNRKDEPVPCQIVSITDRTYQVKDFTLYRDETYREPKPLSKEDWQFGSKELIVRSDSAEHAAEDVERLEIKSSVKRHILTGAPRTEAGVDHTRSGRDWLIITSLIFADYNYDTVRSIFLNPFLKCSNRIREKGEAELRHDVERAVEAVKARRAPSTPQADAILQIRGMKLSAEEKRQAINEYVVEDLLTGEKAMGRGFKDVLTEALYYFDNVEKEPWDIRRKDSDFYYFVRERYGIARKDFDEIRDAVATEIDRHCPNVAVHRVAFWDAERGVLYLSNHNNQILRLDGRKVILLDNGEEGVFFHFDPRLTPFQFDEDRVARAVNYFETYVPGKDFPWGKIGEWVNWGLNLDTFYRDSLLNQYLIARANFAPPDEENPVDEGQQRLLLILYFYSLFFESLMKHKPIVAFLGLAHSGKSTTAEAIGKILLGENHKGGTIPHDARSLKQVMGEHYYYEIDNVDTYVAKDICDVLAGTSTGAGSEERTLGENKGSIFIDTHCFVVITSREPKFKRPDIVDRLLPFRMGKIEEEKVKSPNWMERTLAEHRQEIIEEIVSNLNSIVYILNQWRGWERAQGDNYVPSGNLFRIADYEEFAKKICSFSSMLQFRMALEAMLSEKAVMTVEDDPVFLVIHYLVYNMDEPIWDVTAQDLYLKMLRAAEDMGMNDFGGKWGRYRSFRAVARHLPHIEDAMAEHLYVGIRSGGRGDQKFYTFRRLEEWPVKVPPPYAKLLDLDPGEEHDPQAVVREIIRVAPGATVTADDLIKAWGVKSKGRSRGKSG